MSKRKLQPEFSQEESGLWLPDHNLLAPNRQHPNPLRYSPGHPCCCVDLGTPGCDCVRNIISGVVIDSETCPCMTWDLINDTWNTRDIDSLQGGSLCTEASPVRKCGYNNISTYFSLESGTWYLYVRIAIGFTFPILWRSSLGTLPPCEDIQNEVCTYFSGVSGPDERVDFSSSIVTVSTFVTADCGLGIPCPGIIRNSRCSDRCIAGLPRFYEIAFPDDWIENQCDFDPWESSLNPSNCLAGDEGNCIPAGTFLTDWCTDLLLFETGSAPGGLKAILRFMICDWTSALFGIRIWLDRFCIYNPEGRHLGHTGAAHYFWNINLGYCGDTGRGDCFFGGAPVEVPFLGQGPFLQGRGWPVCGDEEYIVPPFEPWMNPCCTWGGAPITVTPIL